MSQAPDGFTTSDPKIAAAAKATGGQLLRILDAPSGRLQFVFSKVPLDLPEQILNDQVRVSAKAMIDALEHLLAIISQRRARR